MRLVVYRILTRRTRNRSRVVSEPLLATSAAGSASLLQPGLRRDVPCRARASDVDDDALAALVSIDSTSTRPPTRGGCSTCQTHRGLSRNTRLQGSEPITPWGVREAGWTTKIHALVDGTCAPVAMLRTAGQVGDKPQLAPLLEIYPNRHGGTMRLLADKAYSHPPTRKLRRTKHIAHTIPERSDQIARRKEKDFRGGRPPAFDAVLYRHCNTIERGVHRLKHWRVSQPATTSTPSPTLAAYSSPPQPQPPTAI